MGLFDELKDRANDVKQVASKAVGDVYSATRVKMSLVEKESAVRTLYRELGEIVYKNAKEGNSGETEIEDKIAEIDLALEQADELKQKYRDIKNVAMCPSCNGEMDASVKFCPNCGAENTTE